jgi:hypothetical protein
MSPRANILVLVALALGVAYGGFGLPPIFSRVAADAETPDQEEPAVNKGVRYYFSEPVLVAQEEVPAGTFITEPEKMFTLQHTYTTGKPPLLVVHDMKHAQKKLLARTLTQGEICARDDFAGYEGGSRIFGPSLTFRLAADSCSDIVTPRTQVDVIRRARWPDGEITSRTVAKNVSLLEHRREDELTCIVTLRVATAEQRQRLMMLSRQEGTLYLTPAAE